MLRMNRRGQGSLEIAVVFVSLFLLVGGIMKIWLWMNYNIVKRQQHYNATRVKAGTSPKWNPISYEAQWPVKDDYHDEDLLSNKFDPFYVGLNATEPEE